MVVAKKQRREKPVKIEQTKVSLESENLRQNNPPGKSIYIGKAWGWGVGVGYIKREAKIGPLSSLLFTPFGSAHPHASRMYFPLLAK